MFLCLFIRRNKLQKVAKLSIKIYFFQTKMTLTSMTTCQVKNLFSLYIGTLSYILPQKIAFKECEIIFELFLNNYLYMTAIHTNLA